MKNRYTYLNLIFFILLLSFVCESFAQEKGPTLTPPDEPIVIDTEEVHLNVIAQSVYGEKQVPNLTADDLLVVESGDPQKITSIKKLPASVLILMDTGGNFNFGKKTDLTRLMAKVLVKTLSPEDSIAAIQYYDKIETVSDWTKDKESLYANLNEKMFSGKQSRFADALKIAVEKFKSRPIENRNLILISDGLDTIVNDDEVQKAIREILISNVSIHIISYTALQRQNSESKTERFRINKEVTPPRISEDIYETILEGIPMSSKEKSMLRAMNKAQRIGILNLDKEMIRFIENKRREWEESEKKLEQLAMDTGGEFHSPESNVFMLKFAADVAVAIGSQYVISYTPTKSFAHIGSKNDRKIRVSTHRTGIKIRSRQKVFIRENVAEGN